ncbi:hypothetical protein R3X25_02105 [Lutibacter sp. TH_r2]|uniref:hypothetical protein n=1 Tax=Lutibacter sp. TH_r2 TaxID=3082083 RepID=UPI0029534074|nr:hypothetical protein [Lutibacter sp. TH_r2]MDV7186061.1 hypothetical protein [Lutibacter sp. TH_r2]
MNLVKLKKSNKIAFKNIVKTLPIIFSMLFLVSIITNVVPKSFYQKLFKGNLFLDALIGDLLGSFLMGNPITGYIIGNELLKSGISLVAVTTFLVAWVTVGIFQSPAEALFLGKRFALFRNISAFFMAIVVAIITVLIVNSI